MHPNNKHVNGYDFKRLIKARPQLAQFVQLSPTKKQTINFSDADAVTALNAAILHADYGIQHWSLPEGALCPPIPGRADYLLHIHDLIKPQANQTAITLLDIGTGANGIYSLLATQLFNWQCIASDINHSSIENVKNILNHNPKLSAKIDVRHQSDPHQFFNNIVQPGEMIDVVVCNPPFYASKQEAVKANQVKVDHLSKGNNLKQSSLTTENRNFGGYENELWCNGGEKLFIKKMIKESVSFQQQISWFTCLVSKKDHVAPLAKVAKKNGANVEVVEMAQGNKKSRFLAWSFQ